MAQKQNPFQKRRESQRESQIVEEITSAGKGKQEEKIEEKIKNEEKEQEIKQEIKGNQGVVPEAEEKEERPLNQEEEIEEEQEGKEGVNEGQKTGGLDFLQNVLKKPKKEESKGKNLYLSMKNIKEIERLSKKAGKSHSEFVDDLLTEVFKIMK